MFFCLNSNSNKNICKFVLIIYNFISLEIKMIEKTALKPDMFSKISPIKLGNSNLKVYRCDISIIPLRRVLWVVEWKCFTHCVAKLIYSFGKILSAI